MAFRMLLSIGSVTTLIIEINIYTIKMVVFLIESSYITECLKDLFSGHSYISHLCKWLCLDVWFCITHFLADNTNSVLSQANFESLIREANDILSYVAKWFWMNRLSLNVKNLILSFSIILKAIQSRIISLLIILTWTKSPLQHS